MAGRHERGSLITNGTVTAGTYTLYTSPVRVNSLIASNLGGAATISIYDGTAVLAASQRYAKTLSAGDFLQLGIPCNTALTVVYSSASPGSALVVFEK